MDENTREDKLYKCKDDELHEGGGFCKFHDKEYASKEKNRDDLIRTLEQKVSEASASRSTLELIGYQIPEIRSDDKFHFTTEVKFYFVNFIGDVHFSDRTFAGTAHFFVSTFNGDADFKDTKFNNGAKFYDSIFNKAARFHGATFNGDAEFSGAIFNGDATFVQVKFKGEVTFKAATFNKRVFFFYCSFQKVMHFNYVFLTNQELIIFNGDLSKISFANTDITRIRFGDRVVWAKKERESQGEDNNKSEVIIAEDKNRFKIHDERLIEDDSKLISSLEVVISQYRDLRENHEYYVRYEEAGQFFIREMELRRKYKQLQPPPPPLPPSKSSSTINQTEGSQSRSRNQSPALIVKKKWYEQIFSFAALYYAVSNYGESTSRPLIITISVFFIATLYFWSLNGWSMDTEIISGSISRTATAFFPFFSLPQDYGLLDVTLRAIMIPFAGLLFITLRRKLERRFRH